jgi:hypothetical protein
MQNQNNTGNNAVAQQGGSTGAAKPSVQPSQQPECVPGYHWDNSQQQCVPN